MISQIYRLVRPFTFQIFFEDKIANKNEVMIRPTYLSICKADQRYYRGLRSQEVLNSKLPMALIHEAIGYVIDDISGEFKKNEKVVILPTLVFDNNEKIKENYNANNSFMSSNVDGFMQSFLVINKNNIVRYNDALDYVAVLSELISVCINAIKSSKIQANATETILVWGDGSLAFIMCATLKEMFPNVRINVCGKNSEKLSLFSFIDNKYHVDELNDIEEFDYCFECVGGNATEDVINNIINLISPQGNIMLMGVSENSVSINTRMLLEKGINLIGCSRSSREDFEDAIRIMENSSRYCDRLRSIITTIFDINGILDLYNAFNMDYTQAYKTIIKWNV